MRPSVCWTILLIAAGFGWWFAGMQVNAVGHGAFATFPKQYFLLTAAKCSLTIIAFFCRY